LHRVKPQKLFTLAHTPHPHVTQYRGIGIGEVYEVRGEVPTLFYEGYVLLLPQSSIRSTVPSAAVPTTPPWLTVIMRACMPACHHTFSPNPRGYISRYLSHVQSSSTALRIPDSLTFQKREGVEGISGLRNANGAEIPMREGQRRIYGVDQTVKTVPTISVPPFPPRLWSSPL
jgi:hypothetical protein